MRQRSCVRPTLFLSAPQPHMCAQPRTLILVSLGTSWRPAYRRLGGFASGLYCLKNSRMSSLGRSGGSSPLGGGVSRNRFRVVMTPGRALRPAVDSRMVCNNGQAASVPVDRGHIDRSAAAAYQPVQTEVPVRPEVQTTGSPHAREYQCSRMIKRGSANQPEQRFRSPAQTTAYRDGLVLAFQHQRRRRAVCAVLPSCPPPEPLLLGRHPQLLCHPPPQLPKWRLARQLECCHLQVTTAGAPAAVKLALSSLHPANWHPPSCCCCSCRRAHPFLSSLAVRPASGEHTLSWSTRSKERECPICPARSASVATRTSV